jgi:hypothetical protein
MIAIGVIGAILLALGFSSSLLGDNKESILSFFGLITIIVALILYVVKTEGVDTHPGGEIFSGP